MKPKTLDTAKCGEILDQLPAMERADLQRLWQESFGKPPHPKIRRQLMVPILAYRVQELTYGGLKPATRDYLHRVALETENSMKARPATRIKPGTKLLRHWHDEPHEVMVTEGGYQTG